MSKLFTNRGKYDLLRGAINLASDTIKAVLFAGQRTGGATTSGSGVVTMSSTTGLTVGMLLKHANIPSGSTIGSVDSGTQVTLAGGATATATGSSLTLTAAPGEDLDYVSQVSGIEASGTGYAGGFGGSGRKALASKAFYELDASNRAAFDAADLQWAGANGFTATGFGLVKEGTSDADSVLIYYCDDGDGGSVFPVTPSGGNLDLVFNSAGVFIFE